MFLDELSKEEAIHFLNLVSIFARIDNKFSKEEQVLLKEYKEELGIMDEEINRKDYNEIIPILKNLTQRKKKIIYFELVGLALVDGEYETQEIDFLEKLSSELEISRVDKISIANYFFNFTDTYKIVAVDADDKINELRIEAEKIIS